MIHRLTGFGTALLLVAGCTTQVGTPAQNNDGFLPQLSESVMSLADPSQDLTAVKIDPIDGCYVYRHVGPVETTLLPLRTPEGRPICTKRPEPAAT